MMTPSQEFNEAKKRLEKLHMHYIFQLRSEANALRAEVKQLTDNLDQIIKSHVKTEFEVHVQQLYPAIQRIEGTLKQHFGNI